MRKKERENRNSKMFSISLGRIWFGNGYFYNEINYLENRKENCLKKQFFEKGWESISQIQSFSLLLSKYIPIADVKIEGEKEPWYSLNRESNKGCIGGELKNLFLEKVKLKKVKDLVPTLDFDLRERIKLQIESLERQGYKNLFKNSPEGFIKLKTSSRLVVGLGAEHVLETSLTLHHIFGITYIPASTLKGVCRMVDFWRIAEKKGMKNEEELKGLQECLYDKEILESDEKEVVEHKLLFGTQNFKGLLLFLDSYPLLQNNQEIFDLDVITPHYIEYYTKEEPPGDWEEPNPITFLTVKRGVEFCFSVLFDEIRTELILNGSGEEFKTIQSILKEWKGDNFNSLKNKVESLLNSALKQFGVGAKTRLGYGIFE